tara:strand:+ start:237 stop:467 length:231 start_codon:yes stop_codon:yes gene_type:complete
MSDHRTESRKTKQNKKAFASLTPENPDENWRRMNARDGHDVGGAKSTHEEGVFTKLANGIRGTLNSVATRFFDACG